MPCPGYYSDMVTIFREYFLPQKKVQTNFLWITRDYLWINGIRCGEVVHPRDISGSWPPHIWTGFLKQSKIWIWPAGVLFCGKPVDRLPRICPQQRQASLDRKSPTSGVELADLAQMYGLREDIHIIHSPYYYYESHILLNNNSKYLMHPHQKGFGENSFL
jgi:hypothetical protein